MQIYHLKSGILFRSILFCLTHIAPKESAGLQLNHGTRYVKLRKQHVSSLAFHYLICQQMDG